jgi:2-polyprenyl-3-methyl-5-hydroxy-6-metoxy-1,4-benzoquinol methylase
MNNNVLVNSELNHFNKCPVCSSPVKIWHMKMAENENYRLDICSKCGFSFVNPRPSINFLMNYYSSFGHDHNIENNIPSLKSVLTQEQYYPNSTIDAKRLIKTIKSLTNNTLTKKFLDVGCGYGFFSREALMAGFDVIPLELAENEREITHEMTGLNPMACSFEEFECSPGSLSVVFMSQILEHAFDIDLWIKKSHTFLVDEGILAIALPNFNSLFSRIMQENDPFICPPAHLNFFNPKSLSTLLKKHGFTVEAIQWVSRMPKSTLEKRIPHFGKPLLPFINLALSTSLKIIDIFHLGMIINVYARKIKA